MTTATVTHRLAQSLLYILVLQGLISLTAGESGCYKKYNSRRARCRGRISSSSSSKAVGGMSYTSCCKNAKASGWKPDIKGRTCIKCVDIVDGNWGSWGEWTNCSVDCDYGVVKRNRRCDNPIPMHGGKECKGIKAEDRKCYGGKPCPVHGEWTAWTEWSSCSDTCKEGIRLRSRSCANPRPRFGGRDCTGASESSRKCSFNNLCPVDGGWSSWQAWSYCDKECGQGKQTRVRLCNNPKPAFNGKKCPGESKEANPCFLSIKCTTGAEKNEAFASSGSGSSGSASSGDYTGTYPTDTEGSAASGNGNKATVDVESGDASGSSTNSQFSTRTPWTSSSRRPPPGSQGGEGVNGPTSDDEDEAGGSNSGSSSGSAGGLRDADFFVIKS